MLTKAFNVKLHNSTIRKRLNKYGLFGRNDRRDPHLSKKIIWKHGLGLQSWTDETTVEMFGHNAATPPAQTPLPTVKHGGGEVMIWVYFESKNQGAPMAKSPDSNRLKCCSKTFKEL